MLQRDDLHRDREGDRARERVHLGAQRAGSASERESIGRNKDGHSELAIAAGDDKVYDHRQQHCQQYDLRELYVRIV